METERYYVDYATKRRARLPADTMWTGKASTFGAVSQAR
jgi:hypothetical protein